MNKKSLILAIALCILVAAIGISFAYYTSSIQTSGTGSGTTGGTADLIDVVYDAGDSALNLSNAIPGDTASKTFTVTVNPTTSEPSATYAIVLNLTTNGFINNEIRYTLKNNSGGTLATSTIADNQTGKITLYTQSNATTTYNYTLEVEFIDTGSDQSYNANKTLSGTVEVEFAS